LAKAAFAAGALIGLAGGGIAGSLAAHRAIKLSPEELLIHPVAYNPQPYLHEPPLLGAFSFTYYSETFEGAFRRVAGMHVSALEELGYAVRVRAWSRYLTALKRGVPPSDDIAVVHPLYSPFTSLPKGRRKLMMKWLLRHHSRVVCFEVADTTRISGDMVELFNSPELSATFLPSQFAASCYRNSGVVNPTYVVPHGVSPAFSRPHKDRPRLVASPELKRLEERLRRGGGERPTILFFGLHSVTTRKGGDVLRRVLTRLREEGYRFNLVVKMHSPPLSYNPRELLGDYPTYGVSTWLSEEELVYLYDLCDVLLAPHRGGAYELNVHEALARGLPTITTGFAGVMDYVDARTAYLIRPEHAVKVFPAAVFGHIGWGVDPSVEHAAELLRFVLDDLDYCRKVAARNAPRFQRMTWKLAMKEFARRCFQCL